LYALKKPAIYDKYFASPDGKFHGEYRQRLIRAARGWPVIQGCRTSAHINAMKMSLGGFHLYLWRNPWDQWQSYKVDGYLCAANLLINNSARHPEVIKHLRSEIGFSGYDANDVAAQFEWFRDHPLTPEKAYLVFYILWYLGLREGVAHADLLVNIDRLADSAEYQNQILDGLSKNGLEGIESFECAIHRAHWGEGDRDFFLRVEKQAHGLLTLSGAPQREIDHVMAMRRDYEPKTWGDAGDRLDQTRLMPDAERARALVRSAEFRAASQAQRAQDAGMAAPETSEMRRRIDELAAEADYWRHRANWLETEIDSLRQSWSWRLTAPERYLMGLVAHGTALIRWRASQFTRRALSIFQRPLAAGMRIVLEDLTVRRIINQRLIQYPALHRYLLRVARRGGVIPAATADLAPTASTSRLDGPDLSALGPRARKIYGELRRALDRQEKEKS
jgi:hypothetical protein